MYTEKEIVGIAKRENNKKRPYLVVNKLQAKHVPANPADTLAMFDALAERVIREYKGENLLLVGFAETATAIGARLAAQMDCLYMQTTREAIPGVEYLYFTEAHSHATEQKLVKTDLDRVVGQIQRILFVEDEVTTGNTILGIIDAIQKEYGKAIRFSVASLLNGMDDDAWNRYGARGISMHYLVKTDHGNYTDVADGFEADGPHHPYPAVEQTAGSYASLSLPGCRNARRLLHGRDYQQACDQLARQVMERMEFVSGQQVLVLGTEEFMYPAIWVAARIQEHGCTVKTHSTTRSPIAVSSHPQYPLHERFELHSFYDSQRRTFVYDLAGYDKVLVVTDAIDPSETGAKELEKALFCHGNANICLIRWCP